MIFKIVRAWWYFFAGRNRELMSLRLEVCHDCKHRVWFVCGSCGCPLFAKGSDPEEQCPKKKWEFIDAQFKKG